MQTKLLWYLLLVMMTGMMLYRGLFSHYNSFAGWITFGFCSYIAGAYHVKLSLETEIKADLCKKK